MHAAASMIPLHRRIGRRALRFMRPLAAPFLHRLDLRIRSAVDHSDAAETLRRMAVSDDRFVATLGALQAEVAQRNAPHRDNIAGATGSEAVRLDEIASLLEAMDLRLSAMRLGMTAVVDTTARMQASMCAQGANLAAIEQQVTATAPLLERRLSEELERVRFRLEATLHAVEQRLTGMTCRCLDQRLRERLALLHQEVASLETRAAQLVRSTDLLLQRNILSLGQDFAVRTDAGYLLLPAEDPALLVTVVETGGRLEPGTLAIVSSLLRKDDFLIDVGANIGTFTLPAARQVGARGRVLALEPAPRIADLLRRTAALNGVSAWVDVQGCAASDVEGIVRFGLSAQTTHNSLWPPDDTVQTIDVEARPLDALVAPGSRVSVVKIDVEGAELQVWRSMRRIVSESPELVVVLEFGPEHLRRAGITVAAWFAELTAYGHTAWEIDEAAGSLRSLRDTGLTDVFSLNILLMRDHPRARGLRVA